MLRRTPHLEISKNQSLVIFKNYNHMVQVHKEEGEDTGCINIVIIFGSSLGLLSGKNS